MLLVQFAYGGSNILMKIALEKGLNQIVFVVYRHLIAMILLGPYAYVIERMEKVKTASPRGRAKMLGTAICMSGSLFFTFWKGGYLFKSFENRALINIYSTKGSAGEYRHAKENWIKGSALILTSHVAWSAWLILQLQDNSAARKPDEGKGLAKGKVLETSINDYPLTNPDTSERK
ncbi:hypothetical protein H0E87_021189 [Populus deltoides]|uniref:WAT1-related protein n=1 Tax=Populus deltoides TaxID=3696 RepID=A0A8T2XNN5_POPDE|nr:hypothetical protein H0E87_021189 [Populus deltoides]